MTEKEIIELIGRGGREREIWINALFEITIGKIGTVSKLHKFFVKHGADLDEAKDLVQETFIKVVASAASYSGTANAMSWIWQIAKNSLIDFKRKDSRYSRAVRESLEPAYKESNYLADIKSALNVAGIQYKESYYGGDLIGTLEAQEKIITLQTSLDRLKNNTLALEVRSDTYLKVGAQNKVEGEGESYTATLPLEIEVGHVKDHSPVSGIEAELDEDIEDKVFLPQTCESQKHRSVDECVAAGLELFANKFPSHAAVIDSQMDGISIEEIAAMIGRSSAATKEYISQAKKKIRPFISHCTELLSH